MASRDTLRKKLKQKKGLLAPVFALLLKKFPFVLKILVLHSAPRVVQQHSMIDHPKVGGVEQAEEAKDGLQ